MEHLNVQIREEATGCIIGSVNSDNKAISATCWRLKDPKCQFRFEAISSRRDAASTHWGDNRSDDEVDWLATALGARISGWRGAQASEAKAQLDESRRQPGLPDSGRKQR
jgi:hypothetical protein